MCFEKALSNSWEEHDTNINFQIFAGRLGQQDQPFVLRIKIAQMNWTLECNVNLQQSLQLIFSVGCLCVPWDFYKLEVRIMLFRVLFIRIVLFFHISLDIVTFQVWVFPKMRIFLRDWSSCQSTVHWILFFTPTFQISFGIGQRHWECGFEEVFAFVVRTCFMVEKTGLVRLLNAF